MSACYGIPREGDRGFFLGGKGKGRGGGGLEKEGVI